MVSAASAAGHCSGSSEIRFDGTHHLVKVTILINSLPHCYSEFIYSRLSLFQSRRDSLKYFEISVLRSIRCAELRKIPIEQPNFTNEHVI